MTKEMSAREREALMVIIGNFSNMSEFEKGRWLGRAEAVEEQNECAGNKEERS